MKKIFTIISAVLLTATLWAQSPEKMSYQAVVRDANNNLVTETAVGMQISILQGSATGTAVYVELQVPTTNANGLVSIEIGTGTVVSGDFSTIDWANGTYFIKTETDPAGGTNYTITGTSQLLSVPYALHAKTAEMVDYSQITNTPVLPTDLADLTDNTNLLFDGNYNSLTNLPTLFSGSYTDLTNQPTLFSGNFADLTNKPTTIAGYGITDAFDGNYNSLTNLPTLFSGSYTDLTNQPTLFSGSFADLTNKPTTIAGYGITDAFDGTWTSLTGKPTFATVATSGSYNDLTDKPTITDDQTLADVLTQNNSAENANITNLADPVNDQDATTKAYIDRKFDMLSIANQGVTDYDGNHYNAVLIGNQIWMEENMKVTHYPNGDIIPLVTDNTAWGNLADNNTDDAYCYYNNNASGEADTYGALYTWAAAMGDNAVSSSANPSGVQGVCPTGWHLPSSAEWTELTNYLGGISVAGGKLKETGTTHWNTPNTDATNETGFSALPGGLRYYSNGTFNYMGARGGWWSSTVYSSSYTWGRSVLYDDARVFFSNISKSYGYSVRCVKD